MILLAIETALNKDKPSVIIWTASDDESVR